MAMIQNIIFGYIQCHRKDKIFWNPRILIDDKKIIQNIIIRYPISPNRII